MKQLFIVAKNVLTDNPKRMTPQLFEAFVFSKLNRTYWNTEHVSKAINNDQSSRASNRVRPHEIHPSNHAE